jgi:hypothetical protein
VADDFDPQRILETLNRHQVEYVLVGGYAARLHGSLRPTCDIDITPSTTLQNLRRLSAALGELDAKIRVDSQEGLPVAAPAESLRGLQMLNLRTTAGDLDLSFFPAGFPTGYDGLWPGAALHAVADVTLQVAGLHDVIKSKMAAARAKDFDALPELIRMAAQP